MNVILKILSFLFFCAVAAWPVASFAQSEPVASQSNSARLISEGKIAPVVIDGETLFIVRGSTSLPAAERASVITQRILAVAEASEALDVAVEVTPHQFGRELTADGQNVMVIISEDAAFDDMDIDILAMLNSEALHDAIIAYRTARSTQARRNSAVDTLLWTLLFSGFCFALFRLRKYAPDKIAKLVEKRLATVENATAKIVRGRAIAALVRLAVRLIFAALILLAFYYYISFVLYSFAESRGVAQVLITYVTDPIVDVLKSVLAYIPSLITLLVIFLVTRAVARLLRTVFENIQAGTLEIENFEAHWIWPTFNILRGALFLFAVILAFPYIPGSSSAAFQGVSIFVGVMVSMGSNSVVSNALSGLFVLYRRSANVGDRIRIGEHTGDVVAIKLMETYIKSVKNELISIPNAQFLNSELINYSTKIDGRGLLVHTTVGIGYEEPQEKVEAMLIEAAQRTTHIKKSPPPFVLRMALTDFAVNYQINGFSNRGTYMQKIISDLHSNILDVFHENDVQIMTPHYESDTEVAKIPPRPKKIAKKKTTAIKTK